jgi:hypothetical protein
MKRKILVSNQRVKECIDILKSFGIKESDATDKNIETIDNLWEQIETDWQEKYNEPVWKKEMLIHIEIQMIDESFNLVSYKPVSYEDLSKILDVDLYQFNGYL